MSQLSAAPVITSVANAASNTPSALPNGSIAPGSIFVVNGSGLGPADTVTDPTPFQSTSLSGTSATITVNGTTVSALMAFTSDKQIQALLPSNTPTGTGTITVTYNSQASSTARFDVVSNNLGIFTVDSGGQGPGLITYADSSLVTPSKADDCGGPNTACGAANPGDTVILAGTGLGRISGDDASGAGLGQNMPNIPLKVWVGGVEAAVLYQGRSECCIGRDQIIFVVPDDAPTGCSVPLAVQITPNITQVSNTVRMPIANGSRDCTPVDNSLGSQTDLQRVLAAKTFKLGYVDLNHVPNFPDPGFRDTSHVGFGIASLNLASAPFAATYLDSQPLGTCVAKPRLGADDDPLGLVSVLDAGTSFTIQGPGGTVTATAEPFDRITLSTTTPFLVPGDYTISGAGGKDVGPFTAMMNIPISPTLMSPASATGLTVSRGSGMTVTWNGNGSTGHVELVLGSPVDANTTSSVVCIVAASAGTFTIPSYMLFTLANTNNAILNFGLGNQSPATSAAFSASGIEVGLAQTFISGVSFSGFSITN
jgi:uncharacterized protein (TIGR03437 family)